MVFIFLLTGLFHSACHQGLSMLYSMYQNFCFKNYGKMHMMYNFPFKPFYVYNSVVGHLNYYSVNLQKFFISLLFVFWQGLLDLPRPGVEPRPLKWKPGILTSRPPGKSSSYKTENLYTLNNSPFPLPHSPWEPLLCFPFLLLDYSEPHRSEIVQYLLFCEWLISLHIVSSRFTQVVSEFPSFLRLNDSCMFIPHFFLIHSSLMPIWIISPF